METNRAKTNKRIRVLLVDDNIPIRRLLRRFLQTHDTIEVVGEADNGLVAVELVEELLPDAVIMDVQMPVMSGIEATRQIKVCHPDVAVIAFTSSLDESILEQMSEAGASLYLPKDCDLTDIASAIICASCGEEPDLQACASD
jgi:DNA-binding NarL/FixJ family response regulator